MFKSIIKSGVIPGFRAARLWLCKPIRYLLAGEHPSSRS